MFAIEQKLIEIAQSQVVYPIGLFNLCEDKCEDFWSSNPNEEFKQENFSNLNYFDETNQMIVPNFCLIFVTRPSMNVISSRKNDLITSLFNFFEKSADLEGQILFPIDNIGPLLS